MRLLLLMVLFSVGALADEAERVETQVVSKPVTAAKVISTAKWVGTVTLASTVAVLTSGFGAIPAYGVPSVCLAHYGAPRPWCTSVGLTLAVASQLVLGWLIIPELYALVGADPSTARRGLFQWGVWPALGMIASTLVVIAGGIAEQHQYASGQGPMLGGLLGASFGGVTFDVLSVIGATRAARDER